MFYGVAPNCKSEMDIYKKEMRMPIRGACHWCCCGICMHMSTLCLMLGNLAYEPPNVLIVANNKAINETPDKMEDKNGVSERTTLPNAHQKKKEERRERTACLGINLLP